MRLVLIATLTTMVMACHDSPRAQGPEDRRHQQVVVRVEPQSSGIEIESYTLITDNPAAHRRDADAIMAVKLSWPRAMQTKDEALFERILARDFTFRDVDGVQERRAYIRNRVERPEAVMSVRYENVVLQFFGGTALLTYWNIVASKDASGTPETWHMSWADVVVREGGRWKIGASHLISERVERGR